MPGQHTGQGGWRAPGLEAWLLVLFLPFFWLQSHEVRRGDQVPRYDEQHYLKMAYHIVHHGVVSLDPDRPGREPWPTSHRAPGYPAALALGMAASPAVRSLTMDELFNGTSQRVLRSLRNAQLAIHLVVAFIVMVIVHQMTRNRAASALAVWLVGLDPYLMRLSGEFLSENLAVFLFTTLTLGSIFLFKTARWPLFLVTGLNLGLLALTRPAFYYLWIPAVAVLLALAATRRVEPRRFVAGSLLFMLGFFPPVAYWMARNDALFGRFFLSQGGGVVLDIRSRLNMMTWQQGVGSFLYWSRSSYLRDELAPRLLGEERTVLLDRSHDDSALGQATKRRRELVRAHDSVEADRIQSSEALRGILRHPLRHVLATVPIAHRGIYVMPMIPGVLLFACLFVGFAAALRAGWGLWIAALGPAVLTFAFHSYATHNIPRYSAPLIPILYAAAVALLWYVVGGSRDGGGR